MELKWISANRRIAKKTLYMSIGFIGIMLAIGILFTLLPLNSNVASAAITDGNTSYSGVTDSHYANAAPYTQIALRIRTTNAERLAAARIAASHNAPSRTRAPGSTKNMPPLAPLNPRGTPDYFSNISNYANSPAPAVDTVNMTISGGIRKFVDSLPGLGPGGANNLGQYIPVATADTATYTGSDYYEIGLVEYTEQMHSDLNATLLRGYVQLETPKNFNATTHFALNYLNGTPIRNATGAQVYAVDKPHYLGPLIIAQKDTPVRVKFTNYLPTGTDGNLFLPVDTTIVGAGDGPTGCTLANGTVVMGTCQQYTQNRGTIHLHGGNTPWISDGTQDQWTTPAGENTSYPKGVSTKYVPDMDGGIEPNGTLTFYYTNQQSARLLFYHDHAYGLTRLNVYAGVAGAYLVQDPVEAALVNGGIIPGTAMTVSAGTIPAEQIPLVIQDKTFLKDNLTLEAQDPTWPFTLNSSRNDLWFPHVYMPAQNQNDSNINPMGRWDYGPWTSPPVNATQGPVPNPLNGTTSLEGPLNPGTPNNSIVPEAFVDTSLVNGNVYPYLPVGKKAYRFRILNAANDRTFNLQLYYASTAGPFVNISGGGGSGASATATVNASGNITGITITSGGAGYTSAPNVSIFDAPGHSPAGLDAQADATIDPSNGNVTSITVTENGSGYSVPTMCKGAAETNHSLCTEISMVPAVPGAAQFPADWNTTSILDSRAEGVPEPNSTGPNMIQIGTEGGFLPAAVNIPNRPIGLDYLNSTSSVTNVLEKALFMGGAERADVIVDFTEVPDNSTLILYSDSPIPVTGADPRYDYFTDDPDNTITGGAPSTIPGYGPNTRTIMQIRVNASIANMSGNPSRFNLTNLTNALPVAYAQSQGRPLVPESAYNTAFNTSYVDNYVGFNDTSFNFTPAGQGTNITMNMKPKSINDGFDPVFGGLMTVLGVAIPETRFAIPYNNFDPPTEIIRNSDAAIPIGTLADGTQIWRIYQYSVDTHPMHWHMFNVQVINRISQLDGTVKPPDPNELGWRETLRVNPLEDAIVALRPIKPNVPWDLPNNIRYLDVTSPNGSIPPTPFENIDPANHTANVTNHLVNFGEEYVWHCHILGHEESMIMRPMAIVVTPNAPSNLTATEITTGAALNWTDNSTNEINWIIRRATNANGPWTTVATISSTTGPGKFTTVTYNDTVAGSRTRYYYQVNASNVVGDTTAYAAPAAGYPNVVANSTGVTTSLTVTSQALSITANPTTVTVGTPSNVTFNVTGNGAAVNASAITLSGSATGSGTTNDTGIAIISVNATAAGTITATASAAGFLNGTTTLNAVMTVVANTTTVANQTVAVNGTLNATNVSIDLNAAIGGLNVNVTITTSTNASSLNVTQATSTFGLGTNQAVTGNYINVNVSGLNASDLNFVNLTVYYNISELARIGLNEQSLKLYWFNPNASSDSEKWKPLGPGITPDYTSLGGPDVSGGERNTSARYVRVTINHFSTFALVGDFVPATASSVGGSGSSGGGGGVVTGEDFANIAKSESNDKDLVANTPVTYTFNAPELGVYEIAFTDKENENGITLRVEALKGTSKQVTAEAPGTVYKNINILAGTQRMKEALVKFRVENSWLGTNSLAGSDVKLLHWDGSQWTQLETTQTTTDDTYTYYEAKTDSFSPFAISGIKGGVLVPTATPVVTGTPVMPSGTGTPAPTAANKTPGFELGLTVAILSVAYLLGKKRR
ncbi:MAG: PGF-pre-PGF domain-containing protein [Candidatus Methanoperedens sp.]|nr:PGF-pre-PGF domain-containing protein [Candidatus Methanoperedens sp.]